MKDSDRERFTELATRVTLEEGRQEDILGDDNTEFEVLAMIAQTSRLLRALERHLAAVRSKKVRTEEWPVIDPHNRTCITCARGTHKDNNMVTCSVHGYDRKADCSCARWKRKEPS